MFTEPAMVKIVCLTNLKYIRTTLFNKCIETRMCYKNGDILGQQKNEDDLFSSPGLILTVDTM